MRDGEIDGVVVLMRGFRGLVGGLCVRGFDSLLVNLNLRFLGRQSDVRIGKSRGGTFRFIRAEFSRSRDVGTRDLDVISSFEVSELISIGLMDDDDEERLLSAGGEGLGDGLVFDGGSGGGDGVLAVMKFERNGDGGLFRWVGLLRGDIEGGELFE